MPPREYISFEINIDNTDNDTNNEEYHNIILQSERISRFLYTDYNTEEQEEEISNLAAEPSNEIFIDEDDTGVDFEARIDYSYYTLNNNNYCINCAIILGVVSHPMSRYIIVNTLFNSEDLDYFVDEVMPVCCNCESDGLTYDLDLDF